MLDAYSRVRLLTDRCAGEGATAGMFGYIIEVYPDGNYEVEISGPDGTTIAQVVLGPDEVAAAPEGEKV